MPGKALLAFDDPGGGLAVSSLTDSLKGCGFDLKIYSGKLSKSVIEYSEVEDLNSNISKAEAEEIFLRSSPDVLITGTSAGNAEQELRNTANKKNVKSVVVLDFWKDYSRRWLYADYPVNELKDIVCVMDHMTKSEMLEEKFPDEKLIVTGHPYLDKIFNSEKGISGEGSAAKNSFLFLSQPLGIIGITEYREHPFKTFLEALKKFTSAKNEKIFLKVKLHPSEMKSKELSDLMNEYNSEVLRIDLAEKNVNLKDMFNNSEIVFGYNTIAMFEARALNKRTISLNVVPVRRSLETAMAAAGIEIVEANENKLLDRILKEAKSEFPSGIFKDGIKNCVDVIINYN